MKIESLKLKNFRNYSELQLEFPSGVVIFSGANGQGKTNLMEAFYYLLRGESFRPASIDSLVRSGTAAALVEARFLQNDLHFDLKTTVNEGRKQTFKNGHRVVAAKLAREFPVVLFSPESLAAIKEGPEQRRRLVDEVVAATNGVQVLSEFRKALKTRNRILRDAKRGVSERAQAERLLESLEGSFFPLAAELTVVRLNLLNAMQEDFDQAARLVLGTSDVDIAVDYLISGAPAAGYSRSDILSAMHKRAMELRAKEFDAGISLVGPQRHDIRILFAGKDSRFFCSQGQQRTLILSYKIAQILYHHRTYQVHPFLLLDDVLSELDPDRRTNLVRFLKGIPSQIFLTTTDLSFSSDFGDRKIKNFRIEKATVHAE